MKPSPTVFLCYARSDNRNKDRDCQWLDRVRECLSPFGQQGEIEVFHDTKVSAGKKWDDHIIQKASECRVAILLVSPAFLSSQYIRRRELPVLLRRSEAGDVCLLPVLLSPCTHNKVTYKYPDAQVGPLEIKLSDLQHVGDLENALIELPRGEQDRRLSALASAVIDHIRGTGSGSASTEAAPAKSPNAARRDAASRRSAVPGQPKPARNSGVQISGGVHAAPGSLIQVSGEKGLNMANQSNNFGSFNNAKDSFNHTTNVTATDGGIAIGGNASGNRISTGKKAGRRAGPA